MADKDIKLNPELAAAAKGVPHEIRGDKVIVEFRIQDLVDKVGGLKAAGHCSSCLGCSGCKV